MFDIEQMVQAADVEQILILLGVQVQRKKAKRGYELYFQCINPNHEGESNKMSMAESGQYKGLFNCWSCGVRGNLIQLIQFFHDCDFKASLLWLRDYVGIDELAGTQNLLYRLKKNKLGYGNETNNTLPTFSLSSSSVPCGEGHPDARQVEEYLKRRGISQEIQRSFSVHISIHPSIGCCITIPVQFAGGIRSIYYGQPRDGGLKRYPKDSPQGNIIFNYDKALECDRYVMVESVLDVLRLESMGLGPAIACFTNMISERQLELLSVISSHCVFPDRDSLRGWDLVERMVVALGKSVWIIQPPEGKDPGDCEDWEIIDSYANRQRYSDWEVDTFISNTLVKQSDITRLRKK